MSSFRKVQDGRGWLADQEVVDLGSTKVKVGTIGVLFDLEYDLHLEGAQINGVHEEHEVEKGYFYLVALNCGLMFLLSNLVDVLNDYGIAPL